MLKTSVDKAGLSPRGSVCPWVSALQLGQHQGSCRCSEPPAQGLAPAVSAQARALVHWSVVRQEAGGDFSRHWSTE